MEHYSIIKNSEDWVSVDGEEFFENLVKLVEVSTLSLSAMPVLFFSTTSKMLMACAVD